MKEDDIFLAHLSDLAKARERKNQPAFSGFTDPVRAQKFLTHFHHCVAWGGHDNAERVMLGFLPEGGLENFRQIFPIDVLQISFNAKFSKPPTHRDYLGSLMGLGIEREKIGDIKMAAEGALVYASKDISGYIISGLERVGNTPVKICVVDADAPPPLAEEEAVNEIRITVASLRLDAVIAAAFRLPRGKASAIIESEKVFVNWALATNGAKNIKSGDVVTVRGLGRVKLGDEQGKTKKDRVVITVSSFR